MKQLAGRLVLWYFRFFARLQLAKYSPDIIGITGSAGKTTTRNAVAAVLSEKYILKVSEKANSESGIPLDILGILPRDFSAFDWLRMILVAPVKLLVNWKPFNKYVVEMGVDSPYPPKNMGYLLTIVRPRTGIFLNAFPVHSQLFDPLVTETDPEKRRQAIIAAIAQEKGTMIRELPVTGLAILNADSPAVMAQAENIKAKVMTFGTDPGSDLKITLVKRSTAGTTIEFEAYGETGRLSLPYFLPDHYAHSFAAALCINADEGNTLSEGCALIARHFKLPPGRMSLLHGIKGSTIIDSSYNASTKPTVDALLTLRDFAAARKLALLGDMREMGKETRLEHEKVMDAALESADQLFLVGPLMKQFALPYLQTKGKTAQWFDTAFAAGTYLKEQLRDRDVLLVKGSQNTIFLETAIEMLLENPTEAKSLLCRRGSFWDNARQQVMGKNH